MSEVIGILTFDGAEELDFVGPWEVFAAAHMKRSDRISAFTASEGGQPIRCAKGLRVMPDHSLDDAPTPTILIVPGGKGVRDLLDRGDVIDWIREVAGGCHTVASVCTGTLLLKKAGLLEGRRATTHWSCVEELGQDGSVTAVTGVRFVRDGNVITAAGVSAGIDMSLWLVGQLESPEFAREVQHYIEYYPAPPYTAEA